MTFLAMLPPGRLAGAREISMAEQIPMQFLWKILQTLARRKLIRSFRGLHGGYELARPSDTIKISMLVAASVHLPGVTVPGLRLLDGGHRPRSPEPVWDRRHEERNVVEEIDQQCLVGFVLQHLRQH